MIIYIFQMIIVAALVFTVILIGQSIQQNRWMRRLEKENRERVKRLKQYSDE